VGVNRQLTVTRMTDQNDRLIALLRRLSVSAVARQKRVIEELLDSVYISIAMHVVG
jgi:hypothetical protein